MILYGLKAQRIVIYRICATGYGSLESRKALPNKDKWTLVEVNNDE